MKPAWELNLAEGGVVVVNYDKDSDTFNLEYWDKDNHNVCCTELYPSEFGWLESNLAHASRFRTEGLYETKG